MKNVNGFSLIEAALVLGIIGLVIGGLWVAASVIQRQMQINGALELISVGRERASPYRSSVGSIDFDVIMAKQALPGNYRYSGTVLTDGKRTFDVMLLGNGIVQFWYAGTPWDTNFCATLAYRILGMKKDLIYVEWYDGVNAGDVGTWNEGSAVPSLGTIQDYCSQIDGLGIRFRL